MVQKNQKEGDLVIFNFGKKKVNTEAETATTETSSAPSAFDPNVHSAAPEGKAPMIVIRDLHKSYGEKQVLKGLDLEVYEGELFGFIGKNGIGKSTTIDCVIGSKKFNSGTITLNGFDIKEEPLEAKYSFGYVASEPSCYEVMTGYDYLEFVASVYEITEGDFVRNYRYLCARLNLDEAELANPIFNYSHGMKQKLCLVASLLHNPKIWILDEPTVGLDIMAVEELKKMMREYANHGKTVFVTSHNIDLVAKLCDRVAIVNQGKVMSLFDLNREPNRRIQLSKIFMETYRSH
ncbi:MAG: ABC transporter ATP-binding protein [Clostridia bacterium]|nr:ABC transporter ATP-binding protein [Clostridia bacterium]